MAAFSLIDLTCTLGLVATIGSLAVAQLTPGVEDARAAGAVRYVSTRLQQTRMEAISRNRATAMRFNRSSDAYGFLTYVDQNRNGVLSADIQAGIDRQTGRPERLSDRFPGVDFGALQGLPPIDSASTAPGADPIRLGSSDMATFTPLGTATSGTLYVLGRGSRQFAIRILGETGRIRILKFHSRSGQWTPYPGT